MSTVQPLKIYDIRNLGVMGLLGLGHGATHWLVAVYLFMQPYFRDDLGLTTLQTATLFAIFKIGSFFANFGSGMIVDVTGRRVIYQVAALLLGGVSLLVFGLTQYYLVLGLMVFLLGCAHNLWHPPAITYLAEKFPRNRGFALSIHGLGASAGDAAAPAAAGLLMLALTWNETAMVTAAPAFICAVLVAVFLLPLERPTREVVSAGTKGAAYWTGVRALFRDRAIMGLSLAAGFRSMAQQGVLIFMPFYLADVMKLGPGAAGLILTVLHLGGSVSGPVAGFASDRIGRRPVMFAGLSATTVIVIAATFITDPDVFTAVVALLGVALFAIRPVLQSWMMDLAPPEFAASATSVMFGIQTVLAALVAIIGGWIVDTYGLVEVFYFIAGLMLVANALIAILPWIDPRVRG